MDGWLISHAHSSASIRVQSGALAYGMKLDERIRVAPNAKLRASREWPQCTPLAAAAASVVLYAFLVVCGAGHACWLLRHPDRLL